MCGIAGAFAFRVTDAIPPGLAWRMADHLVHRGPDDRGEYRDPSGRLALAFTRLSIIDPVGGHQPMRNVDGSVWIAFNGEIYNYRELRSRLRPHVTRTQSDTEVILHLYEERGLDAFQALRGMFAIALWDGRRRRLILVRDRLGIKPLYYAVDGHRFLFASDASALVEETHLSREVDGEALRTFLQLRAIPAPRTLFQSVKKLAPGHLLVCDEHGPGSPRQFWALEMTRPAQAVRDEMEAVARLREHIDNAVASHMVADVPVGALLSGGLDSSVIVAAMRRHTGGEIHTFNVGFAEDGYGEFPYAREVARRFETRHHEYVLSLEDFVGFLPRMVREFADPVADPAAVPLYFIARVAREQGITVVLSGEGSDELFAGYSTYASYLADAGLRGAGRRIARAARAWWRRSPHGASALPRLRGPAYPGHAALPDPDLVDLLLAADPTTNGEGDPFAEHAARARAAGLDRLQTMLVMDLWTRIPEDLLCRTDRMTMANSVEARVPFLDHEMVEFGFWMPSEFKLKGGIGKYALKRAAEAWLPTELIYRPKMGFPTPIRRWLSGELSGLFRHWLLDVRETPPLLDYDVLQRLLFRCLQGEHHLTLLLWRVWFFKLWYAHWVNCDPLDHDVTRRPAQVCS